MVSLFIASILFVDTFTKLFFLLLFEVSASRRFAIGPIGLRLIIGKSLFGYSQGLFLAKRGLSENAIITAIASMLVVGVIAHVIKVIWPDKQNVLFNSILFLAVLSPCFLPTVLHLRPEPFVTSILQYSIIRVLSGVVVGTLWIRISRQRYVWIFVALMVGGSVSNLLTLFYFPEGAIDWLYIPAIKKSVVNIADIIVDIGMLMVILWLPLWLFFRLIRRLPFSVGKRIATWLFTFEIEEGRLHREEGRG